MTKVTIISGFLGAGKTTFIKKLIEEIYKGQKVVLIENEFGEIGIDGGFLKLLLSIRSESKDSASQGQKQIYLLRQGRSPFSEKISKFRLRLWISILNH